MNQHSKSKDFFSLRILVLLLLTFLSLLCYSTLNSTSHKEIQAQTAVQLGNWQSTPPFPDDGSPYGSFVRNGIYYVNTTHIENGIQNQKYTYMGTPGADGNIASWTKAWQWHGGTHGFGSVTVQWDNEQKVFMTRNGHIAEYVFNPDGTINGNDYKFWGNEKNLAESFDGRLWVWDSLVFAPLTTGRYVYHLGGFSCAGHGCKNTCTDAGCSGADVNYKNNGNIYFQKVPFVHWTASEQNYKFKYTGKNHPDYKPTVDNIDAPGKSVFYAPNGGADYGFIYVTRNRSLHLYKVRVNSDGTLGDFTQEKDLLPALNNSQDGYDRGDIFVIGNTFFAARGRRVFSAPIDPATGALGNWDDSVPDLPADQVEVMGWGRDNEGAMWGIIGNYVYLTGQHSVYYAKINGYTAVSPPAVTGVTGNPTPTTNQPAPTATPAGSCPTTSSNTYESWQMDQNSAANTSEAKDHADKNIHVRGWESSSTSKQLYDRGEPIDSKSPQLSTLFDQQPAIVSTYKVYDWNWSTNTKGSLLSKYDATLIGLSANAGTVVRVPDAKFDLVKGTEEYGGYTATILYADANSLTIKYTLQDDVVSHYTVHLDNFCVDPNLLSLYNQLDAQKYSGTKIRFKLPILKGKQPVGTSNGSEVRVAIRNSGEFIDPRLINSFWRGVSALPTAAPTATPGGPTSPAGGSPTATPKPGSCSAATMPVVTSPTNSGALPGKVKIVWKTTPGAKYHAIRIDDMTNGWKGDCSVTQNPGDLCVNNISGSATSYEFTGIEGHTYYVWLHSINYCGSWSEAWQFIITTPPVNAAGTCRIQGYRTVVGPQTTWKYGTWMDKNNPQYSHTIWVPEALRVVPVSATGGTVMGTVQENPYFITVAGNQTYTVTIQPVSGYSIGSTYCVNSTACHGEINTNQTLENGNTRTITCPANGYADLWWLFFPSSVPTMSVPRPTATPGGANLTPTIAPPTPTVEFPSPTPSPCPAIEQLEWREGERYERAVISYDGVNIIENISLHLKQITQSGLVVQVSTDGGTTWAPSDSSQNDDHFVTIKNRNTEVINLKVRLLNSCAVTSPELLQTIQTVPLPSISAQPTSKPSTTPGSSPMVPALIVGGAVLTVAAVAIFFLGI